jgi:Cellulase (glycosyl hydrolase family 5)
VHYCYCAVSIIIYQNEPHGAATWGLNEPTTDWNKAAERIVQGIVKAVPTFDRLIFVEGVASDAKRWLTPAPPDYELTDPAAIQVRTNTYNTPLLLYTGNPIRLICIHLVACIALNVGWQ